MYECYVEFVPKGCSPHNSDSMKTMEFETNYKRKSELVDQLYKVADSRDKIDSYSLRNHWEIFKIDIFYHDPPWSQFEELCSHLMSYDEALGWKSKDGELCIKVSENKESKFIKNVKNYYKSLNPRKRMNQLVVVDLEPKIE
jgi:16S rRNA G966 N2-methylase RsmD